MERPPNQYEAEFPERRAAEEKWQEKNKDKIPKEKEDIIELGPSEELTPKKTFSPEEEVKNILKTPKKERRKKLENFKEQFALQNERMAVFYEDMISKVRKNPDAHLENFVQIRGKALELGLSPSQVETAVKAYEKYMEKHNAVASTRQEHPDDAELYEFLFKTKPSGKIEVVEGPITLYFRCFDMKDYARIHGQTFLQNRDPNEHEVLSAKMSGGVNISHAPIPGLAGCIIAENSGLIYENFTANTKEGRNRLFEKLSDKVRLHEEQHAIKKIFSENSSRIMPYRKLLNVETRKEMESVLRSYFVRIREQDIDPIIKDEILAYFKENRNPNQIYAALTKADREGGLYDYWEQMNQSGNIPDVFQELRKSELTKSIYERTESEVFKKNYFALIENSVRNTYFLENAGYTKEQVIAMLINEPLSKWPKVVGRLVAGKRIAKERE